MAEFTSEKVVSWLGRSMPEADQITWLNITPDEVRFNWRGRVIRVAVKTLLVEESHGSILASSDLAALIGQLIRKQWRIEGQNTVERATA